MTLGQKTIRRIADTLEARWATPAYAGWALGAFSICFFGAATNTMSGWLYVISGVGFALLGMAAVLPARSLKSLKVRRLPIEPVSAGDQLTIRLEIENPTDRPKTLLQIWDILPLRLGTREEAAIEEIPPRGLHRFTYYRIAEERGAYRWHEVQLRTGTPLGLFWCRRSRSSSAKAIVYPQVLPLNACPLIDRIGQEDSVLLESNRRSQIATSGVTRNLRPYRHGDPMRLIHWRTSARYGEFRVRELEISTAGQEIIIALDSSGKWNRDDFEQAVIAAASLYFYASRSELHPKLWTAATELVYGDRVVLEVLAATRPREDSSSKGLPLLPLIWLTQNPVSLNDLPPGSRWLLWPPLETQKEKTLPSRQCLGLEVQRDKSLQLQLQSHLT
ncbi:MAG: DUF58 domain-containing protein [Oscillatoria sp. SIO1A7]|nr:DUF58 domain-containing protein [Oscillatoria sp. SIO1A7]